MPTLREIASIIKGKVIGTPNLLINGVSDIADSVPETITFLFDAKRSTLIEKTAASAIIVADADLLSGKNGIVVDNPRLAMAKVLALFEVENVVEKDIHPSAIVHPSARIDNNVHVGAFTVIGKNSQMSAGTIIHNHVSIGDNVIIGENVAIHPQVAIHSNVKIGDNSIIYMHATIGSCGFGFETVVDKHFKIPQIGSVIIENDVEIGANTTIDRGTISNTIIGAGTKIDNLVQIAHNVKIGKGCLFVAQVGIAGSVEIGDYCIFAGQVGVGDGITIGNRAIFVGRTGVTKSLAGGKVYSGMPAKEVRETLKRDAAYAQIDSLKKRLKVIENSLGE